MVTAAKPSWLEEGPHPPVAVVGAGNWLVGGDRIGPMVIELIRGRYGTDVEICDAGSAGLALLDYLAGQDLMLIVDACVLGGEPGEIIEIVPDLDAAVAAGAASVHQIGPIETLLVARHLFPERLPRRILLILVETQGIDDTTEEAACTQVVTTLDNEIERWRSQQVDRACSPNTRVSDSPD